MIISSPVLMMCVIGHTTNQLDCYFEESCTLYLKDSIPPVMSLHFLVFENGTVETWPSKVIIRHKVSAYQIPLFFYIS